MEAISEGYRSLRRRPAARVDYAKIVGSLLGKGHARTSGASMIAGYVGSSDKLDKATCRFARADPDQTESDHRAFVAAIKVGRPPAAGASRRRA